MGVSTSKPETTDGDVVKEIENKKVFIDKALIENITGLNDILTQFSKNDTQGIVDKIKSMEEFKDKIPESVLSKVGDVHRTLLDTIDSSLTESDKKKQLETDAAVASYIQKFVDKDLDVKMKDYLQNPFIQNDPVVAQSMNDVTNSIKTIRGKYKYFEYKYVQMNIFLILFTKHVHNIMKKFIDETSTFYAAREKYHLVLIHNVVKTFQQQLGDETKKLTDINTEDFTKSITELTKNVMESITTQKQLGEKMKNDSLAEILKYLMERETEFAQEVIKGVDTYKTNNPVDKDGKLVPTVANIPEFISAGTFQGAKPGYSFTSGPKGQGYYLNARVNRVPEYGPSNKLEFISAASFEGAKEGYSYTSGPKGQGYYLNTSVGSKPEFIPSQSFVGPKSGYNYTNGPKGQGYYISYGPVTKETFIPAIFQGAKPGYTFKNGPKGEGYYLDNGMTGGSVRDGSWLPKNFFEI